MSETNEVPPAWQPGFCVPCAKEAEVTAIMSTARRRQMTVCREHHGPYVRRLDHGPKLTAWSGALVRQREAQQLDPATRTA